jgi:hypothetical protein
MPRDELDAMLERVFAQQRGHIRAFLIDLGALPVFPGSRRRDAMAVLRRLARDELSPFSTMTALEVMRLAPPTAPPGLLRATYDDPPFGLVCLRVLALDAMVAGPDHDDLAFFRANLIGAEPWVARRAVRALARDPRSVRELAETLSDAASAGTLEPDVSRELIRVLGPSGLWRDERLVLALLESSDESIVATALRALTAADSADDVPPVVVRRVATFAASQGAAADSLRSEAMSALAASGDAGIEAIRGLVGSEQLAPSVRIEAAGVLADHDPQGAAVAALALIPAIGEPRRVAAAAGVAAIAMHSARIQEAIERWQASHPSQAAELDDELHGTRSSSLQEAMEIWETASRTVQ